MQLSNGKWIKGFKFVGKKTMKLARQHFGCENPILAFENDSGEDMLSHWEKAVFFYETMMSHDSDPQIFS